MLYLVATPIGNLSDLSLRAIDTLKDCDYILCEDTRHSSHLLHHYQIHKPLRAYHRFNESKQLDPIIQDLKNNLNIALISDAGTPVLCDPGHLLVKRCREEQLEITAVGGPCSATLALVLSGFDPLPFQFVGFLPKKDGELRRLIAQLLVYEGTSIAYETAQRIEKTLQCIGSMAPERTVCVMRELTKIHEEWLKGSSLELLEHFKTHPPRGELVLLIERSKEQVDWSHLSLEEHVLSVQKQWNLSLNEAIKMVAQLRSIPKREVYKEIHQ